MRLVMLMGMVAVMGGGLTACKSRDKDAHRSQSARVVDAAGEGADARPVAGAGQRPLGALVAAGDLRGAIPAAAYQLVFATPDDAAHGLAASKRALASVTGAEVVAMPLSATAFKPDLLRYFGVELDDADLARLAAASTAAVAITVETTRDQLARDLRRAAAAARAGAVEGNGWIVDPITAQTFSIAGFDRLRPADFPLSALRLISIHGVRDSGGGVFLETVGLRRFGLPELFVRNVPTSFADDFLLVVNAAAQSLIERGALARDGEFVVDTAALTTAPWPERHRSLMSAGGTGTMTLQAFWSAGDAGHHDDAPIIELEAMGTSPEALVAELRRFIGGGLHEERMQYATKDKEAALEAARQRAMAELAALAPRFANGVPDLEHLLVKAPFATDSGGGEWMWVEVHEWKGTRLRGILTNRPFDITALKEGAEVEVAQDELFDYIHQRADGTTVGGQTTKILGGE